MLDFPSPAAVAANVRLRLRNLSEHVPILIVEGKTDRAALSGLIRSDVVIIPASNKEKTLGARDHLQEVELHRCTFLVDCDGDLEAAWRSSDNVIISDWRDLDADMAIKLGALTSILRDHLAEKHDTGDSLEQQVEQVFRFVTLLTAFCGTVTDAAKSFGAPTRVEEARKRRRRLRADDLNCFASRVSNLRVPKLSEELIPAAAERLGWDLEVQRKMVEICSQNASKQCRLHSEPSCLECLPRTYVNGHDLVSVLRETLKAMLGNELNDKELSRQVRLAIDTEKLSEWRVLRRIAERGLAGNPSI